MRYLIINLLFILSVIVAGFAARTHAADSSSGAIPPSVTTTESPIGKSGGPASQYPSGITSPPVQPPNLTDGAIKKTSPKVRSDSSMKKNLDNSGRGTPELERKHSGCGLGHDNKREQ